MNLLRVTGRDCCVVEKTKAHRLFGFRVVAWWAACDEDVVGFPVEHVIHGGHRGTDAGQRCLQAFRRGIGICLDAVNLTFLFRNLAHHGEKMAFRMGEKHRIFVGLRGLLPNQSLEIRMFKRDVQRAQPVRSLGMPLRGNVFQEDRMLVKPCGHGSLTPETREGLDYVRCGSNG